MGDAKPGYLGKALLVIDIQEDYTGSTAKHPFPYRDSERLIAAVNRVIAQFAGHNLPIVYIKQVFGGLIGKTISRLFCHGTAMEGHPGAEIDRRIAVKSDVILPKPLPDAFSNPALQDLLAGRQVKELYLVGLDAAYCVHATAKGALKRGYSVSIITDCIALQAAEKWHSLLGDYQKEGLSLVNSADP